MDLMLSATVARAPDAVSADVRGEVVIMCINRGRYYALDRVGTDVWTKLGAPRTIADLCDELKREYDSPKERLQADVLKMLGTLLEAGAIRVIG